VETVDPLLKFLLLILLEWIEDMVVVTVRRLTDLHRGTTLGIAPESVLNQIVGMNRGDGRMKGVEKKSSGVKRSAE
jgi:hypothetical protein